LKRHATASSIIGMVQHYLLAAAAVEPERLQCNSRGQSGSRQDASRAAPGDAAPLWRSLKGCNMRWPMRRECSVNVRPLQGRPIGDGAVPGAALRFVTLRSALPPAIICQPFRLMRPTHCGTTTRVTERGDCYGIATVQAATVASFWRKNSVGRAASLFNGDVS